MNVQTEKLENHVARLKVEIEPKRLEDAKKAAAKRIAKQVNIPGFRKGKAPYRILVNYVGEGPILEEAIEELGNDIYQQALDESEVEPYTSGQLEDFQLDPAPTFVFTVPLQPTVEMGDYRSVRVDFAPPEVEDKDVDDALRRLQEEHALVEESQHPAKMGDRIAGDVHGFILLADDDEAEAKDEDGDEAEAAATAEGAEDANTDGDEDAHDFSNADIHEHDTKIYLDPKREPVAGFADALVGVEAGEDREFVITYPDEEQYGSVAGRQVRFVVEVDIVENVTLPELNDAFAARVTEEEDEPLTLLELRARIRENITTQVTEGYKGKYVEKVINQLVEKGTFAFPKEMVINRIEDMVESIAQQLGLAADDYLRLLQKSREDLAEDETYRDSAEAYIKRSLVMRGILEAEQLTVDDSAIEAEISQTLAQFGEQADTYSDLFDTPNMRANISNNLLEKLITDRIVEIGRGITPDTTAQQDDITEAAADAEDVIPDAEPEADTAPAAEADAETSVTDADSKNEPEQF